MKYLVIFAAVVGFSSAQLFSKPFRAASQPFRAAAQPFRAAAQTVSRAVTRTATNDQNANILRQTSDINPDGSFQYSYELDNGIVAEVQGTPRNLGGNPPLIPVVHQGSFAFTSPEGQNVAITYIADENGFQPQGDAIPTPPPIPAQIARALEYIAKYQ